jgi:hypothetical protein
MAEFPHPLHWWEGGGLKNGPGYSILPSCPTEVGERGEEGIEAMERNRLSMNS